jgi:glycine/D-amino acid oxidase-like deaminating enzyme
MRQTECIIVGQGISGTFLSWFLEKAGRSYIVIDNNDPASASRVAAGIINPVTGRRIVKTWKIDELMPFALDAYTVMGKQLHVPAITEKSMIDFFPSPQMLNAFTERLNENDEYLSMPADQYDFREKFNYDFGYGVISPCYTVNLQEILPAWRTRLKDEDKITEDNLDINNLQIDDSSVRYKDIHAEKIIFCDGVASAENPFFKNLPFAINKGEALIIEADGIEGEYLYKKGMTIVPLNNNLFWTGSSHEWNFTDAGPTALFLERTTDLLKQWLRLPFRVMDHMASLRPATIERRPFIGLHPHYPSVGIFNGMGTKGCSLAPFFASQLVEHLIKNTPILAEASVNRFSRILSNQIK